MKPILPSSFLLYFLFCFAWGGSSQTLPPGSPSKFGIDGDVYSDQHQNGNMLPAGSHDWFRKAGGTGMGLIDTTGGAQWRQQLSAGGNIAFVRRMHFQRYAVHDNVLMMDGCYARDFMSNDKTMFAGNGTKNTASPLTWGTAPAGGNVSDKTDILDSYVSMRRNGNVLTGSNTGALITTMALSTLATSGDRYADFEFFKERVNYNTTSGKFENTGPVAYAGHSLWEFNTDGSVKSWGDMTISFSFNSSSVSDIKILIWVSQSTLQTVNPQGFDFIPSEFYPSTTISTYGYAAIKPDDANQMVAWGAVNTAATATPLWGSNSKDVGNNSNNYFSDVYSVGQFAEAAVDLTALGMDPAKFMNMSACNPPFTRFLTKSRSSSSFSSALSDFNGPFEFLDVPTVPATTTTPAPLTCAANTTSLSAAVYLSGAYYNWFTNDGNITGSNSDSSVITVNKKGTYYLTAAITKGCVINIDSAVVTEDKYQPVATASASGMLLPASQVSLFGGDTAASNYATPSGGSMGLLWNWKGPLGFTSTLQNPVATSPGEFKLVVTEKRNGCTDTAITYVFPTPTLPVVFSAFTLSADRRDGLHHLAWNVVDASRVKMFEAEASSGNSFITIDRVYAVPGKTGYHLSHTPQANVQQYRIKATGFDDKQVYSPVVSASAPGQLQPMVFYTGGHKNLSLHYTASQSETLSVRVLAGNGQLLWQGPLIAQAGKSIHRVTLPSDLTSGIYFVQVLSKAGISCRKIFL